MGLLEAMACGAAVVDSYIPAIASVVDPRVSGLLTPVGRPDRLAAALLEAFTRRAGLGAGARAVIESRFSRPAVGPALASCFERPRVDLRARKTSAPEANPVTDRGLPARSAARHRERGLGRQLALRATLVGAHGRRRQADGGHTGPQP